MTDREILIELLAIKLFEHGPPGMSWTEASPEDRQFTRDEIVKAMAAKDLYDDD